MDRTESLPSLSDRGRGLAELKGHDPMDRRLEVEKKERYAQALREQMAYNSACRGNTPERESANTPQWGPSVTSSVTCAMPLSLSPSLDTPPASVTRRARVTGPLGQDSSMYTADKVAEVQDVMRQRIQMLQDEQHRQWQSVQAALQQVRDAAEQAVQQQLEAAWEGHAAQLREALAEMGSSRRESAADLAALRHEVQLLTMQGREHKTQLDVHTSEIERLKKSHEDCAHFRAQVLQEQRSLSEAMTRLAAEVREGVAQLRAEQHELARKVGDVPGQLRQLRDEVPRLASQAARDVVERNMRLLEPAPAPAPAPPPPATQHHFPAEVSEEAFAVLRNAEGELYELPALQNVVGRSPTCNVCIAASQAVSNKHASVDIDREGKSSLKDMGSRNGTFLNDHRVPPGAGLVIRSGDSIRLGGDGPTYIFEFGPAYYARWPSEPERVRNGARTAAAGAASAFRRPSPNR